MDIVYSMPGQSHRMFINVIHACPNKCLFCVDFKGDTFFGFNLKNGRTPTSNEIVQAVKNFSAKSLIKEIYFCGIGEPLLRYQTVIDSANRIREIFSPSTIIAINTSGTFYARHKQLEFARYFDLIQVSLNAENEDKYNSICRPKVKGAYKSVMLFLQDLKDFLDRTGIKCKVELSVIDLSDNDRLPIAERLKVVPQPDIDACQRIADSFGWPLKVKKLIKDCEQPELIDFSTILKTG